MDPGQPPTRVRYFILVLLSLAPVLAYLARNQAPLATSIQQTFQIDDIALGTVLAGFAAGYLWFQVPGGWFANFVGVRIALPVICVAWSLCTLWASMAHSTGELFAARFCLGLAQAGLVPACAHALADWIPVRERGMASAAITVSMQIGGAAAGGAAYLFLSTVGWRGLWATYAIVGMVWVVGFALFYRNRPSEHARVNAAELDIIHGKVDIHATAAATPHAASAFPPVAESAGTVAWRMLTSLSLWMVCWQGFFRAFAYEFFATWFPAYLEKGRNVSLADSNLLGILPIIATGVGSLLGGIVVDVLFRRTGNKRLSRSGTAAVALTLCAAAIWTASFTTNTNAAVAIIALGQLFASLAASCTWAATLDISGRHAALVFGVMNTIGNLGSLACPKVVGHLIDYIKRTDGDWNLVLYLFVAVNLAGAACWLALNPNRSAVEWPAAG